MSRVGKQPIPVPSGVDVKVDGVSVTIKGKNGELKRDVHPEMRVALDGSEIIVTRPSDRPNHKALHGLTRALLANMVTGVDEGFKKVLEMHGVGYRAQQMGKNLQISVGFSHPVDVEAPQGITFEVEGNDKIIITGSDKEQVGQIAAEIRQIRPPEPYKGKGIRYEGEYVRRKAGKAGKTMMGGA